jgi:hypothetical protein
MLTTLSAGFYLHLLVMTGNRSSVFCSTSVTTYLIFLVYITILSALVNDTILLALVCAAILLAL